MREEEFIAYKAGKFEVLSKKRSYIFALAVSIDHWSVIWLLSYVYDYTYSTNQKYYRYSLIGIIKSQILKKLDYPIEKILLSKMHRVKILLILSNLLI